MRKINTFVITIIICLSANGLWAQIASIPLHAKVFLEAHLSEWKLLPEDISEVVVSDNYVSQKTGIKYIYIQQTIRGIPIDGAITPLYISKENKVGTVAHRFISNLSDKLAENNAIVSTKDAIVFAAKNLGINDFSNLKTATTLRNGSIYTADFSLEKIEVKPIYVLYKEKLVLCHQFFIHETNGVDIWSYKISVQSGEIIDIQNQTISCTFPEHPYSIPEKYNYVQDSESIPSLENNLSNGAIYKVYPLPGDSPNSSGHALISNPHIEAASPFGWHDTNGAEGPEFTITRGNNTHAYDDTQSRNSSNNDEPDGGESLLFNFSNDFTQEAEADTNKNASITNLFYANNMAHDLSYLLGFTEEAGNYQEFNYSGLGKDGDYVRAEGHDGSGKNNANFSSSTDGNRARMQMFLFDKILSFVAIESPENLSGLKFETGTATFGPSIASINIEAELAIGLSNNEGNEGNGCEKIDSEVNGKIALIDRGVCDFSKKVFNVQEAGAVMAIVCNIPGVNGGTGEEVQSMGDGDNAAQVTIPSVFMKKSDCDLMKLNINNGVKIVMSAKDRPIEGPRNFDSNYDNGVILHEYGHGISLRLTGGPNQAGCLPSFDDNGDRRPDRGEQMGEGWSDYFALIWTTRPSDSGEIPHGVGTYVSGQDKSGPGIRSFPYTTDMSINPLTYDDIKIASVPHGVGTVWATVLWDMHWNFIEKYGFKADWADTTSGNYRAAFLVMEGMKLQPCRPGMVDGRDAILKADSIHYNAENSKMIWESFAKRGLGYLADQRSSTDQRDGTEDFTVPPQLLEEIIITKSGTEHVDPGGEVFVTIQVKNYVPSTQTSVIVKDEIPNGLSYVTGSGNIEPTVSSGFIEFDLGDLEYLEEKAVSYWAASSTEIRSIAYFVEDVESISQWQMENKRGDDNWIESNAAAFSGTQSFFTPENSSQENDQRLVSPEFNVQGKNPTLRFWHRYDVASAVNGGFLEISEDKGVTWTMVNDKMILRNLYTGGLDFQTFGIPGLSGFSGTSEEVFKDSYLDLNEYKGKDIQVRFRFGTQPGYNSDATLTGWYVDDIELMDLSKYSSKACVSSGESTEEKCSKILHTVVNVNTITSDPSLPIITDLFEVFPNPANKKIQLKLGEEFNGRIALSLINSVGKTIWAESFDNNSSDLNIDVAHFPSGNYFMQARHEKGIGRKQIVILH